jgi:tRNA pseudouridine(38-40) synthase
LPEDIRVLDVAEAPADFHARFSAKSKTYRYQLVPQMLAIRSRVRSSGSWRKRWTRMHAHRGNAVVGTHDFAAFQSVGTDTTSTVRTVFRSDCRGCEGPARTSGVRDRCCCMRLSVMAFSATWCGRSSGRLSRLAAAGVRGVDGAFAGWRHARSGRRDRSAARIVPRARRL